MSQQAARRGSPQTEAALITEIFNPGNEYEMDAESREKIGDGRMRGERIPGKMHGEFRRMKTPGMPRIPDHASHSTARALLLLLCPTGHREVRLFLVKSRVWQSGSGTPLQKKRSRRPGKGSTVGN